jgi:PKD repeat protein
MRRFSLTARRMILALSCTVVASLVVAAGAQAQVINDNGTEAGVSLVPSVRGASLPSGVSAVTASGSCTDPWLTSDFGGPLMGSGGLCYRGGAVMQKNETFTLTWDQQRAYWSQTLGYVQQYLRDVADSSGSLGTPYALTTEYNDNGGRAQDASLFGGGCVDDGVTGGSACQFGNPTGAGHNFPSNGCTPAGDSFVSPSLVALNDVCLTDSQLQSEVSTMVAQTGVIGRTQPGYTPLLTLLLPPGVETCLDSSHTMCSSNGNLTPPPASPTTSTTGGTIPAGTYRVQITYKTAGGESSPSGSSSITTTGGTSTITIPSPPSTTGVTGWYAYVTQPGGTRYTLQGSPALNSIGTDLTLTAPMTGGGSTPPGDEAFCSYHSQVNVGGTEVAYVVQPWTAGTGCDEPDAPSIPPNPTPLEMAIGVGQRLVSPLSQAQIAAIVDPGLNGWAAQNSAEIDDNGCVPEANELDQVTVGNSSQNPYYLQREFNNAATLVFDPNTYFGCAPDVILSPGFVVPSSVDEGDVIEFDGTSTATTLLVPAANYHWNFGDGTTATGPSVVHSYSNGGNYNVTLTVTDRGGNTATLTQAVQVFGANGVTVTSQSPTGGSSGGSSSGGSHSGLNVHLQLLPQSLKTVLRNGISVRVTSNQPANGIATVSITRASAKKAGIKVGNNRSVRIGLGTVASIKNGTVSLRLHLSRSMAKKLGRLHHVAITIRLQLVAPGGHGIAVDVAGRY